MFTPFSSSRPTSNIGISVDVDTGLEVKPDAPTLPPFIAGEAAAAAEGTLAVAPPPQVDREGVAVTLIAETRFTLYPPLAFALPNLELLAAT